MTIFLFFRFLKNLQLIKSKFRFFKIQNSKKCFPEKIFFCALMYTLKGLFSRFLKTSDVLM